MGVVPAYVVAGAAYGEAGGLIALQQINTPGGMLRLQLEQAEDCGKHVELRADDVVRDGLDSGRRVDQEWDAVLGVVVKGVAGAGVVGAEEKNGVFEIRLGAGLAEIIA